MKLKQNRARYELTMRGYSYILVLAMLLSIVASPLSGGGSVKAEENLICDHVHDEACYATPMGHVCSVEEGCEPIYPMKTVVVGEGHMHENGCYGLLLVKPGHEHGAGCYKTVIEEIDGETVETLVGPVCGLEECDDVYGPDYDNLNCDLLEAEAQTEEVPDTEAEPIGWICNAEKILVCEHAGCEFGGPCLVEQTQEFTPPPSRDRENTNGR